MYGGMRRESAWIILETNLNTGRKNMRKGSLFRIKKLKNSPSWTNKQWSYFEGIGNFKNTKWMNKWAKGNPGA